MENKSIKRGGRWREFVCLFLKERKGRREEGKIKCGYKSYIKWDFYLEKLR